MNGGGQLYGLYCGSGYAMPWLTFEVSTTNISPFAIDTQSQFSFLTLVGHLVVGAVASKLPSNTVTLGDALRKDLLR